jgi:hypothetical protein
VTLPRIPTYCPHCHHKAVPDNPVIVIALIDEHPGSVQWWRATCHHRRCQRIITHPLTFEVARLFADTYPDDVVWLDPPREARPQLGPWTPLDKASVEVLGMVHDDLIWDELDVDLSGTDSGIIDWGDDR